MSAFLRSWLVAFLLTQMVELGVYTNLPAAPRPLRERLAVAFGASAITHPLVWFVITPLYLPLDLSWWTMVVVAELFAWLTEAGWLVAFGYRARVALGGSLLANGLSYTIGLFCYEALGW